MASRITQFFRHGGAVAWGLIGAVVLVFAASTALLATTFDRRYERDVTRMVFNDNLELLNRVRKRVGAAADTLKQLLESSPQAPAANQPYLVISIADHRIWYKQADSVLFTTQVATGSGKTLQRGSGAGWRFETPRGRLVVESKEIAPVWVPPDWHFVEAARNRGLGVVQLNRGQTIPTSDGGSISVVGGDVVKRFPDGRTEPMGGGEGREIVANGNIIVPPYGTSQRKYEGVLGTHRLNMGDGYALHGTNKPETIGRSVSHGCVRLRNEDIARLYELVPTGTPVFIY